MISHKITQKLIVCFLLILLSAGNVFSETIEVEIEEGWNLISVPFQENSQPVTETLLSIAGQYRDIWAYNPFEQPDPWKHFHPENISFSDLDTIELNKGYWLYSYQKTTFTIDGDPVTTDQTIQLKQGWNLIGWPFLDAIPVNAALSSLVFGVDYDFFLRYDPIYGKYEYYYNVLALDQFHTVDPGRGYYIHCLGDRGLTFIARHPPELTAIGDKILSEGETLEITLTASDTDNGDVLTYFASNLPAGASFDPKTDTFIWKPDWTQAGVYDNVIFEVSDGIYTDKESINITVLDVNQPPEINAIGTKTVKEGSLLEFTVSAVDIDNNKLIYSAGNLPLGAEFNPDTRTFKWQSDWTQAGEYPDVRFVVTDGFFNVYEDITITVIDSNRAPVLDAIENRSVTESDFVEIVITAQDPDGDDLIYSTYNLPEGSSFDDEGHKFIWQTSHSDIGRHKVFFSVKDQEKAVSQEVVIQVNSFNQIAAYEYLAERMDMYSMDGPRLIESYADPYPLTQLGQPNLQGYAYVYDNALAVIALVARGGPDDIARAKLIIQVLMDLQMANGRIRDYYDARIVPHIDNSAGSHTGNMAWVMNALGQYYKYSNDSNESFMTEVLTSVQKLGDYVYYNFKDVNDKGYFLGVNENNTREEFKSTENNISLYAAYMLLYEVTENEIWKQAAEWAGDYALTKFNGEYLTAGTGDELVEDVNSWALLAFGRKDILCNAINWVENNMLIYHHGFWGFDFDCQDLDGIWFEGTAHMSAAYQAAGRKINSGFYLEELRRVQKQALEDNEKAIVSACHSKDDNGAVDGVSAIWYDYFKSPHIAATCWYILVEREINPLWGTYTDDLIPYDPDNPLPPELEQGDLPAPQLYPVTTPTNIPVQVIRGLKASDTSIWLNGNEVVPIDEKGNFECTVILTEGENNLRWTAKDKEGQESEVVIVNIILDTVPSDVRITAPSDNLSVTNPIIDISGTAASDAIMVEVNGKLAELKGGAFFAGNVMLIQGVNAIHAEARDKARNTAFDEIRITLDTVAPKIPIIDEFDALTNVPIIRLTGIKEINSSIWMNGREAVPITTEVVWGYDVLLREGENELRFSSKDVMGNESGVLEIRITLDTEPPDKPHIDNVDSPTNIGIIILSGTWSSDTKEIIIFSGEASVGSIAYPSATAWSCNAVLQEGNNKLTVFAEDEAGNRIMGDEVEIILDTTPPLFDVLNPEDGSYIGKEE